MGCSLFYCFDFFCCFVLYGSVCLVLFLHFFVFALKDLASFSPGKALRIRLLIYPDLVVLSNGAFQSILSAILYVSICLSTLILSIYQNY